MYTIVLLYSDFYLYRCLAYVCEGIFAPRMYVAVTSLYPWDRRVTSCPEPSLIYSWRKWWRALPTSLSNAATMERSWNRNTKLQSMPVTPIGDNLPTKDRRSRSSHRIHSKFSRWRLPINEVFNAIKDQPWVKHPKPFQYNHTLSGAEEYCSYHDGKRHQTVYYRSLRKYLKELIAKASSGHYPERQPPVHDSQALCLLPNSNTWYPVQGDWV